MTDNQLTALQKVHAALPEAQQVELSRIMNSMVAGGFVVNADGKSRPASSAERFVLARVAQHYGLDPLMGQLYLLGGKPYVSYKALYRAAVERGFRIESRPMTREERDLLMLDDDEIGFASTIYRGADVVGSDYGTACEADVGIARGRAGRRIVRNMAQTRAERRVLDKVLGISAHDSDEPAVVDARRSAPSPSSSRRRLPASEASEVEARWEAAAAPAEPEVVEAEVEEAPEPEFRPETLPPVVGENGDIFPDFGGAS